MSEVVIILGAGASKQAGAPLMGDFLDVAHKLQKNNQTGTATDKFEMVSKAIAELDRAQAKSFIDMHNLETAFAALEMAKLIGRLGNLTPEEIDALPHAMQTLILQTLEQTIQFPASKGSIIPPRPYNTFAEWILGAFRRNNSPDWSCSIITFNYDLCLDYAFHYFGIPINYALNIDTPNTGVKLLKLHGSLNWARCQECGQVIAWEIRDYFARKTWHIFPNDKSKILNVASQLNNFQHCATSVEGPVIVPPTWSKGHFYEELTTVWSAAAMELSNAEEIIVCGYSLPETDQFFRYLYALGSIGDARLRRFSVFNPDKQVENRFKDLLGRGVLDRFKFYQETFENAIDTMSLWYR